MEPDDLYGLPLDRFVAQRAALARALRADGRRDQAAAVASMRKPSVAAWAVNQLVRTQQRELTALFEAGDALREAQAELLAGRGDGSTLRAAGERERAAVEQLVVAARGLLTSEGQDLSGAVVERAADTLHAAALDTEARELMREGRLERELRHAGLGLGEGGAAAPEPRTTPRTRSGEPATPPREATGKRGAAATADAEPERARVAEQRAEAQRAKREQASARKAARAAQASAGRRADRAALALRAAEERRDRAAQALGEADEALAAAREEAIAADAAQRSARADLEER